MDFLFSRCGASRNLRSVASAAICFGPTHRGNLSSGGDRIMAMSDATGDSESLEVAMSLEFPTCVQC